LCAFAGEHNKQMSKTNAKYSFQRRGAKKKSLEAKNFGAQFFGIAGQTGNCRGFQWDKGGALTGTGVPFRYSVRRKRRRHPGECDIRHTWRPVGRYICRVQSNLHRQTGTLISLGHPPGVSETKQTHRILLKVRALAVFYGTNG